MGTSSKVSPHAGGQLRILTIAAREAAVGAVLMMLDPASVQEPNTPNREPGAYRGREFDLLRDQIRSTQRNVVPIHVLKELKGRAVRYTLVCGSRRLRACRELGIPVFALVTKGPLSQLVETDRLFENLARRDLLPVELGRQLRALQVQTGVSMRQMAGVLNLSVATISRAIKIAQLPEEILALLTPAQLQYRVGDTLDGLLTEAREAVIGEARLMANESDSWRTTDVLKRLKLAAGRVELCNTYQQDIVIADRVVAVLRQSASNKVTLDFRVEVSPRAFGALAKKVASFMRQSILRSA